MDEGAAPDNVEGLQHCSDRVLPAPRILIDLILKHVCHYMKSVDYSHSCSKAYSVLVDAAVN